MKVANYLGKVNLYVVHGVEEPAIVENDENEIMYLREGPAESGEGSGVGGEAHVEGDKEDAENENVWEDDKEDAEDVEVAVEVDNEDIVEFQSEEVVEVDNVDEVELENDELVEVDIEDGREVENEEELEVDIEDGGEVHTEEELEVDIEDGGEVHTEEDSDDEPEMDDLSGDEYVDADNDQETQQQCRGLSDDDDWESDMLVTPENSTSEEDDNEDRVSVSGFSKYAKQKSMADYKWEVGTIFSGKEDFKDAIRRYAVQAGRDLKFVKNDKRRVRVRCMGGQGKCPWVAYCGYLPSRKIWQLRKIIDTHGCSRQLNIKLMNAQWLSQEIDRSLVDNPNLRVNDIRTKALRKWNTNVSISKARRAKLIATRQVEGDFKEQYKRIYDYGHELLRCNPGSTVQIKVDSHNGDSIFQRMYVCLKACKDSFISCRPIICLDGCFLKGYYKGELLTGVGRDPNDQMLPLAYAVVEVENKDS
ncbi:uncharacterized protein LOC128195289 [Vigna angularis]|uniref:uncharacterized protein LOC128195289 n=1 Tax=Phaseolus angularis TaxID=3914 RepID=UPI0022B4DFDD|nr:uncharacterized protein LOC128195289 [Vigna angularis]